MTKRSIKVNGFLVSENEWKGKTFITIDGKTCKPGIGYWDAVRVCGQPRYSPIRSIPKKEKVNV